MQIHRTEDGQVRIFSRNQEDSTAKFPDIIELVPKLLFTASTPDKSGAEPSADQVAPLGDPVKVDRAQLVQAKSFILDCEAVAFDVQKREILPFQILSTRKRKVLLRQMLYSWPVQYGIRAFYGVSYTVREEYEFTSTYVVVYGYTIVLVYEIDLISYFFTVPALIQYKEIYMLFKYALILFLFGFRKSRK